MLARIGSSLVCGLLLVPLVCCSSAAETPYGLDTRAPIGPYLNNSMPPQIGAFPLPSLLSATGAFSDIQTLSPSAGVIPYNVNSPLWSDGAAKKRWIAVPNDGAPYSADEQITFSPTAEWGFPPGTVFIKHFELTVNESTGETRRLETRLLVRDATGGVYGVTYRWLPDNSDAELLPDGLDEAIHITAKSGETRDQNWTYPSRSDCVRCHNGAAGYVLGVKTRQLNGDSTYPATGRVDNQLRVFAHLGLLNPAPSEADIPNYLTSVAVTNATKPVQHRIRSWIDANCSQCHRPGGERGSFDARLDTPVENQYLINAFVRLRNLAGSQLYFRDNLLGDGQMPPLAKNVVDESAMAVLRQWIASPFAILRVYLEGDATHLAIRFNSHVDPVTATVPTHYSLDQNHPVTAAAIGSSPDMVLLTVASPLTMSQTYALTVNDVQDTAASANTIWPGTQLSFAAQFAPAPATRLANISTRVRVGGGGDTVIGGFIVRGTDKKRVMLRAIGPSLAAHNVANPLSDPMIELHDSSGNLIASNDDWVMNANAQEIIDTSIAPDSAKEAAIVTQLPATDAGTAYTAVVRSGSQLGGVGLLEVYDLDHGLGSSVVNISSRGHVDLGENAMIGGFIIAGTDSQRVIVRAIGPSLTQAGVADALQDPMLELHNSNGDQIAFNDNWGDSQKDEVEATAIPPASNAESAMVTVLAPGGYTAIVRGVNNGAGIALVEAYQLSN